MSEQNTFMIFSSEKVIITGAPGTGKTAVIQQLSELGYPCYPEVARHLISLHLKTGKRILPWTNNLEFSKLVLEKTMVNIHDSEQYPLCFFDRGLPDTLAYLKSDNIIETLNIPETTRKINYFSKVFYTPFWEEIYTTDSERRESKEKALEIEYYLISTYKELGFELIALPKTDIISRSKFILDNHLKKQIKLNV